MTNQTAPEKLQPKDFASDQEVRWCPGCGDYAILKAVHKTLAEIGATTDADGERTEDLEDKKVIDGDFDDATRARLHDVARRCPVHKTLENGVVFDETVYAG